MNGEQANLLTAKKKVGVKSQMQCSEPEKRSVNYKTQIAQWFSQHGANILQDCEILISITWRTDRTC